MARRSVWLRRDPVGSRTSLPSREEFRGRLARRSLAVGVFALAALAVLVMLRSQERWEGAWSPLFAVVFWLGVTGAGAAAVALRTRRLRGRAVAGLGVSLLALTGALFVDGLADAVR